MDKVPVLLIGGDNAGKYFEVSKNMPFLSVPVYRDIEPDPVYKKWDVEISQVDEYQIHTLSTQDSKFHLAVLKGYSMDYAIAELMNAYCRDCFSNEQM